MAAGREMGEDAQVQLTRVEGKIDRLGDRLDTMKEDMGEMKAAHTDLSRRTDDRFNSQGERIRALESIKDTQAGERTGVRKTVVVLWALLGLSGGGLGTAIAVHFLHL